MALSQSSAKQKCHWSFFLFYNAVHHSKASEGEKCTLVNETKWQYYGTPNTDGNLTVIWTQQTLVATHVNIEVWGYQETGKVTLFLPAHKQSAHVSHMQRSAQQATTFIAVSRKDLQV